MSDGIRPYVGSVKLFQELHSQGLSEEEILTTIIKAKSNPGKVMECGTYKFRYSEDTNKYEDNQINKMISKVTEGADPGAVIQESQGE